MGHHQIQAELAYPIRAIVGEGSLWDVDNQRLLWVDILDHKVYAFDPGSRSNTGFDIGQDVGTVVITTAGLWAYADQNGIGFLNPETGEITQGPNPEKNNPGIRFNDGKCDPRGTFWAGTMAYDCTVGAGTLYEFDAKGGIKTRMKGTTMSNGLIWDRHRTKFYFIDSLTYQIHQYRYDKKSGDIHDCKVVSSIDQAMGMPDGMTIDEEDHLWVALFDGGKVIRINPQTGKIVFEVALPVPKVTSCAFGGPDLDELYITTASHLMDKALLEKFPLSGSLFRAHLPFRGVLPNKMNV